MKDLISVADLSREALCQLLQLAGRLKRERTQPGRTPIEEPLKGKNLALIFQKPSTRTAVSFAIGMHQLGGFPLLLPADALQWGRGEAIADTARSLSRYVQGIVIRAKRHADVVELAQHASVPVINGLSDREHPSQVLSDLLTLMEHRKVKDPFDLRPMKVAFLGDGNNVAQSWLLAASLLGCVFHLACPKGYEPEPTIVAQARQFAGVSGAQLTVSHDPQAAANDADVLYTDVWTSMGKEREQAARRRAFRRFQLNQHMLGLAKPDVLVMHCLPARRGEEITAEVLEGPHSVVFDQAENRLHLQKALLLTLLGA
ncbi:MAG: ornithine carbamoyltransferase [Elusimicrobia bacterium]|nr:ornithine carbamoyltransferase [Elusimicrobiota bacterium]